MGTVLKGYFELLYANGLVFLLRAGWGASAIFVETVKGLGARGLQVRPKQNGKELF